MKPAQNKPTSPLRLFFPALLLLLLLPAVFALDPGCNAILNTASATYTMTADCSVSGAGQNGYNISAASITLDCAGHSITGDNTSTTYGVYVTGYYSSVTVKNCQIKNFSNAIYDYNGGSFSAYNNTITQTSTNNVDPTYNGAIVITGNGASNSQIYNNTINNTGGNGIVVYYDNSGIALYDNTIYAPAGTGIHIWFARNANISNSTITALAGIDEITYSGGNSYNNTITNVSITASGSNSGISITGSGQNNSVDCQGATITGSNASGSYGIYSSQTNTTVKNCNISNFHVAVLYNGSSATNGTIQNNTLATTHSSGAGIYFNGANNYNQILNNTISSAQNNAILILATNSTLIDSNTISSAYSSTDYETGGIRIDEYSYHNNITNNNITATNTAVGIQLFAGNTLVQNNRVTSATSPGIACRSNYNYSVFYGNNVTTASSTYPAMRTRNCHYLNFTNNTFNNTGTYYSYLSDNTDHDLNFTNNTFASAGTAIYLVTNSVGPVWFYNNTIYGTGLMSIGTNNTHVYGTNSPSSLNGGTGYDVESANTTIDCAGYSITGNNSTSTYGVYSNQLNTTLKNCVISGFDNGVYFNGANNGTIYNVNATKTYSSIWSTAAIKLASSNYNTISNSIGNTSISGDSGRGILLMVSSYNTIVNSTGIGSSGSPGIQIRDPPATNNLIVNCTASSSANSAFNFYNVANNNTLANSTAYGSTYGVSVGSNSNNLQVINVTINASNSGSAGFYELDATGQNNSIDCQGASITGSNTSSTYGVYSNQFNTTIKNCNIANFSSAIIFVGANNGTIFNNSLNSTLGSPIAIQSGSNNLNISNNTIKLNTNSPNPGGIRITGGDNISINCMGASITGNNSSATYGVYSNQFNTTIKNCNIKWFETSIEFYNPGRNSSAINNSLISSTSFTTFGVAAEGSNSPLIFNNTISSVNAVYLSTSSGATVAGNTISTTYRGITTAAASNNALYANNTITATGTAYAIALGGSGTGAANSNITNNTLSAASGNAIYIVGPSQNISVDCQGTTITGSNTSSTYGVYSTQLNTTVKNCRISNFAQSIYFNNGANGTIYNNTLNNTNSYALNMSGNAGYNNITNNNITAPIWVSDSNGTNYYNSSTQGNIYYFFTGSPSWDVFDIYSTTTHWANLGSARPFNASTTNGNWSGLGEDWFPYTESSQQKLNISNCAELTNPNNNYILINSISASGVTCINITVENISLNCDKYNIIGNNSTSTYGIYSNQFNTTIKNCNIANFSSAIIFVGANNGTIFNNSLNSTLGSPIAIQSGSNNLNISNNTIKLNTNSPNPGGIRITGGDNISINCMGASITGNNSSATYGVYSNQFNTTIKNCNIKWFETSIEFYNPGRNSSAINNSLISSTSFTTFGVAAEGSNSPLIFNNTISSVNAVYLSTSSGATVAGNTISTTYRGITTAAASNNALYANNTITATGTAYAIALGGSGTGAANSNITNNTLSAASGNAIYIVGPSQNISVDCQGTTITGSNTSSTYGVYSTQLNTTVKNCRISNFAQSIYFNNGANGTIYNNTLNNTNSYALNMSGNAGYNNITNNNITAPVWVSDNNGTNYYNTTTQGNIYYFTNGTPSWASSNGSSLATSNPPNWSSTAYGVNATNFPNSWTGAGSDYWAWTGNPFSISVLSLTVDPNPPTLISDLTCDLMASMTFTSANVTYNWFINGVNQTGQAGTYTGLPNNINTTVSTLSHLLINPLDNISCSINAQNGSASSGWVSSANDTEPNLDCSALSYANHAYNLTTNVNISGNTCFNITAANITLDCNGYSITGDNTSSTYGVYSNQLNTTVRNCIISNFDYGIFYNNNANNSLIINNTINLTRNVSASGYGIEMDGVSGNLAANNTITARLGIRIANSASNYNNFTNNTITTPYLSTSSGGAITDSASSIGNLFDCQGASITGSQNPGLSGAYLSTSDIIRNCVIINYPVGISIVRNNISAQNNTISQVALYGINSTYGASSTIDCQGASITGTNASSSYGVYSPESNTTVQNCIISNFSQAIYYLNATNGTVYNNTLNITYSGGYGINMSGSSGYTNITNNNITAPVWVSDNNGTNFYNTSTQGNIYYFTNGTASWQVFDIYGVGGWATSGNSRPFNATTVGANFSGSGSDWFPYTTKTAGICGALSTAGATYTLTSNYSITGATCFNITAANIMLDCAGYSIKGSNTSSTYGVYSNQFNTTVKNCNISNFAWGAYLNGATSSVLQNDSITGTYSTGGGIYLGTNSSGIQILSSNITSSNTVPATGSLYATGCFNITFANSTVTNSYSLGDGATFSTCLNVTVDSVNSSAGRSAFIFITTNNSRINNSRGTSTNFSGLDLYLSPSNNVFENSYFYSAAADEQVLRLNKVFNSNFTNNTFNSTYTAMMTDANTPSLQVINNTFTNNTIISSSAGAIQLDANSSGNLFHNNSITAATFWVNNSNSSNNFNTSTQGNIYYFTNGTASWEVFHIYSNASNGWADSGTDQPFNATTVGGNWTGLGEDWHPYTENANPAPTIASSAAFTNSSAGHWFYANATASDYSGASDIIGWNISSTSGSCINYTNTTSGSNLTLSFNCTGTALENTTLNITFIDSAGSSVSTDGWNIYPNQAPSSISSLLPNGNESFTGASSNSISINWTNSTDADNDQLTYWLYYSSDGGSIYTFIANTTDNPYTWNSSAAASGSGYRILVYTNDSYNLSSNVSSADNFTIQHNTAPNISALSLTPSPAYDYSNLSCSATYTDNENATLTLYYNWFKNGVNQTGLAGSATISNNTAYAANLSYGNLSVGDNWSCAVYASDGINTTSINYSSNLTIQDGSSVLFCKTLTTAGQTYSLGQNVSISGSTCFTISAQNITLNCNGYSITGNNSTSTYGVYSTQFNTTIKNCQIRNFSYGIMFEGSSSSSRIINNTINVTASSSRAISMEPSPSALIENNTLSSISYPFYESNSNDTRFNNNNVSGGGYVFICNGLRSTVSNNRINTTGLMGIDIGCGSTHSINVTNNTIIATASGEEGITVNGGSNVSIDCQGATITGSNTSSTYGIYSNQSNTTIKNCNISNFDVGIYYLGAANGLIQNNTLNLTLGNFVAPADAAGIFLYNGSNNNTVQNNNVSVIGGRAYHLTASNYTLLQNNYGTNDIRSTMHINTGSNYTTILNNTISSVSACAVYTEGSYQLIANNTLSSNSGCGLKFDGASFNNATGNRLSSNSSTALWISGGNTGLPSSSNLITSNTLLTNQTALLFESSSTNNTLYYNNISALIWVNDTMDGNNFNTTTAGNIYYFPNGTASWSVFRIYDNNSDSWADLGLDRPFNATTVGGNWSGVGQDWFPYTTTTAHAPSILSAIAFTNATTGHWFYANATAYDPAGGTDIKAVSATSTLGACAQFSNSTNAGNFSVVYNCSSSSPSTPTVNITFNDSNNATISTSSTNAYPDPNNASLTAPSITPSPAQATSTLTCNNGTFSDIDSDAENASARAWRWFKNGAVIASQTAQTLAPSNFNPNDAILCEETATAQNWTTSSSNANSSSVTIQSTLDACATLSVAGASYNLTQNVSVNGATCFNITAANVTLDCAGYTISGNNSTSTYGVYSTQINTTVKNCIINNFSEGIELSGATSALIQNNTINTTYNNTGYGIRLVSSSNNVNLTQNTIYISNLGAGISTVSTNTSINCQGASIRGTNTSGSLGVVLAGLTPVLQGCTVFGFESDVQSGASSSPIITNNTFGYATSWQVNEAPNAIYANNLFQNATSRSIAVCNADNMLIANNTFNNSADYAVSLECSTEVNTTILNNTIFCSSPSVGCSGIHIFAGTNTTIDCQGSSITGSNLSSTYGILSTQTNTTVKNCQISNFQEAIQYSGATDGLIQNNTVSSTYNSTGAGIHLLSNADRNQLLGNAVNISNYGYGVYVSGGQNITVDCQGASITGFGSAFYGVFSSQINTTIENCLISNFSNLVQIDGATAPILFNNTLGYSPDWQINTGTNATIASNRFSDGSLRAIALNRHNDITIANNTFNMSTSNVAVSFEGAGGNRTQVLNNTIFCSNSSNCSGILVNDQSYNSTIDCMGAGIFTPGASAGIGISASGPNTTIKNCPISNFSSGLVLLGSNLSVFNNTITSSVAGGLGIGGTSSLSLLHWRLDEIPGSSAPDSAGSVNGTVSGAPSFVPGFSGGAYHFGGASDAISANLSASLHNSSLTFWFKASSDPGASRPRMAELAQSSSSAGIQVILTSSGVVLDSTGGPGADVSAYGNYADNAWHWTVATRNDTIYSLYIDGALANSTSAGSNTTAYAFVQAGHGVSDASPYDGAIDNLRVYNSSLSPLIISTLYLNLTKLKTGIVISNNTVSVLGTGIELLNSNATVSNNTISNASLGLAGGNSSGALFYSNNVTAQVWAVDGGANNYNSTTQGNIYYFPNGTGSWNAFDIHGPSGWATGGNSRPFNATTVGGNWSGYGSDWYPYTTNTAGSCGALSTAGATYTLTSNYSINGATCFSITAQNITLDCAGYSITGNNSTSTYGVYSNQFNTTVKDCQISNFDAGIFMEGANQSTVRNNTVNLTKANYNEPAFSSGIVLYDGTDNSLVFGNNVTSMGGLGIFIHTNSTFNTIANNTVNTSGRRAINLHTSADSNLVENNTAYSASNTSLIIQIGSRNNTVRQNSLTSGNYTSIIVQISASDNQLTNNTVVSLLSDAVQADSTSGNNTFYQNNITAPVWVNDSNGTNNYNFTLANGTNAGNIYYFQNGTGAWQVFDIYGPSGWATGGMSRPFNATTVGGNWSGSGQDWFPYTNKTAGSCGALSTVGATYTLTSNYSITGSTCFSITAANITLDCAGYTITGNNATSTYGVYSTQTNTTVKNCNISNFQAGIYLNGANSSIIQNNTINTTYGSTDYGYGILATSAHGSSLINNTIYTSNHGLGVSLPSSSNVTVDCQGASIMGDNASSVMGMYSSDTNVTLKNCVVGGYTTAISAQGSGSFVLNNTVTSSTDWAISTAPGIVIANNLINNTRTRNIVCNGYSGATIANNTMDMRTATAAMNTEGNACANLNYYNNTVFSSNGMAFQVFGSGNSSDANISIDCQGLSITGANTSTGAFYLTGTNISVSNCRLTSFGTGISLFNATNASITNNTINITYNNTGYGIKVNGSSNGTSIANNTIYASNLAHGIFVGSGSNTSIDCQGATITGSNASSSYGVYSTQANTTIKNCQISNFNLAVYLDGAASSTVANNTLNSTSTNSVTPCWDGVVCLSNAGSSSVLNNNVSAAPSAGLGIRLTSGGTSINVSNNNITSSYHGLDVYSTSSDYFINNTLNASGTGIYLTQISSSTFLSNYVTAPLGTDSLSGQTNANNVFTNNTFNASTNGIRLESGASSNSFYYNNITAPVWINDTGSSNAYNTTSAGNIYYLSNGTGSWNAFDVYDTNNDTWADQGNSRPFNATTVGGNWSGSGQDWFPYTANTAGSCGVLSTAGATYTLAANYSINGSTCFTVSAANITLDCAGYSITGNNSTSTYGVYSTQSNTTIQNCNISNFSSAIYLSGASNSTIQSNTLSSTYDAAGQGYGVYATTGSDNILIQNNNMSAYRASIRLVSSLNSNISNNPNLTSQNAVGINLEGSNFTYVFNNTALAFGGEPPCGISLHVGASHNTIVQNTLAPNAANSVGVHIYADGAFSQINNTFTNNTINATTGLHLDSNSGNNTFLYNNITSSIWVNDTNGTNYYNTSTQGNIYYFTNGTASWQVFDIYGPSNWATGGNSRPFNATTVGGNWSGSGSDWFPYTSNTAGSCGALSTAGATYTLTSNYSITGLTCFNITAANITLDCAGYSITGNNSSSTYGVYSNQANTTVKNCQISNFDSGVYFNGASNGFIANNSVSGAKSHGFYLYSSSANNTLANNNATLSQYGFFLAYLSNNNTLISNNAYNSSLDGFYLESSPNNTLANNNATLSQYGFYLWSSPDSNLTGNNAYNSSSAGFYLESGSDNTITSNYAYNSTQSGFYLISSSNNNLTNNTLNSAGSGGTGLSINNGQNTSIDCQGASITGSNTSGSYGVYSNQSNTSVKNCVISNFEVDIGIDSTDNSTIQNNTLLIQNGNFSTSSRALSIQFGGAYTYGHNVRSNNITCLNCSQGAIAFGRGSDSLIENNLINYSSSGISGSYLWGGLEFHNGINNLVVNNTVSAPGFIGIQVSWSGSVQNATNNTFINNTVTNASVGIQTYAGWSYNNTFYMNSITANIWVNNSDASNAFNATLANGTNVGNIYYFANGTASWNVFDIYGPSGWATGGNSRPFNATTVGGNWSGSGSDWFPYTANTAGSCGALSTAGATYTLASNYSINGATCFNITAQNITLDCAGYSITGNNASSTYGVYSTQTNTTVKNCQIQNFSTGIYYTNSTDGTIQNNTINTTFNNTGDGIRITSASDRTTLLNNAISTSNYARGIYIDGGQNVSVDCQGAALTGDNVYSNYGVYPGIGSTQYNTTIKNCHISGFYQGIYMYLGNYSAIQNNTVTAGSSTMLYPRPVYIVTSSDVRILNNTIIESIGSTGNLEGLEIQGGNNSIISGNNFSVAGTPAGIDASIVIWSIVSNNVTISNNSFAGSLKVLGMTNITNSVITNNTMIGSSKGVILGSDSGNNTFYMNNITASVWVNDANGTNSYNFTLANGTNTGNIYYFPNGTASWNAFDIYDTNSDTWADQGNSRPFNATTTGGNWSGSGSDWFPYTTNTAGSCGALSTAGATYTLTSNYSINGATCFNITAANITLDCAGYSITGDNSSLTYGVYSTSFNTTVKNCNISNFSIGVYFSGASNGTIQSNTLTSTFVGSVGQGYGVRADNLANNLLIQNNTASSYRSSVVIDGCTNVNVSSNPLLTSQIASGVNLYASNLTYVFNNTMLTVSSNQSQATASPILLHSGASSNTILANTLTTSSNASIYLLTDVAGLIQTNNTILNNTITNAPIGIHADLGSGNNTFLYNNITADIWIMDNNGTNYYNTSSMGNIYYFQNSTPSWQVYSIVDMDNNHWADTGYNVPLNSSVSEWSGSGNDYHPYTDIYDTYPNLTSLDISPSPAYKTSTLYCTVNASDNEQTNLTISYEWYKNDTNQTSLAGSMVAQNSTPANLSTNVSSSLLLKGDSWFCRARAHDTMLYSNWTNSSTLTIINSLPNIQNMNLTNLTQNSMTQCRANVTDGDGQGDLVWVNFTVTDPSGRVAVDNVNGTSDGSTTFFNSSAFNLSVWGDWNCSVTAVDNSNSSVTLNGTFTVIREWQKFYGGTLGRLALGSGVSQFLINWSATHGQVVYVAEPSVNVNFTYVYPLGTCPNGSLHTGTGINDFGTADNTTLGLTSASSRTISSFFDSNGDGVADSNESFMVFGRNVPNVPVAKITSLSPFSTGVFWQGSSGSNLCFNGVQDLVFAVSINKSAPGLYGTSDYELMIPEELASYKNSSNRLVAFYGEYRGQSG